MRLLIAGHKQFGAETYRLCRRLGHDVVAVAAPALASGTSTDGHRLPDRLRATAEDDRVPWIPAGELRADRVPGGTDLILAAHSHDYLGRRTRLRARLGAIGYHPSLLPLHRGRDAVRWTIKMGDRVTGGTVYWLSDALDAGDVAAQDFCLVRPCDSAAELWRRDLFPLGLRLFERVLKDLARGVAVRIPQDEALATWEPSWDRPPVFRPELPLLGTGAPAGYRVVRERWAEV